MITTCNPALNLSLKNVLHIFFIKNFLGIRRQIMQMSSIQSSSNTFSAYYINVKSAEFFLNVHHLPVHVYAKCAFYCRKQEAYVEKRKRMLGANLIIKRAILIFYQIFIYTHLYEVCMRTHKNNLKSAFIHWEKKELNKKSILCSTFCIKKRKACHFVSLLPSANNDSP